MNYWKKMSRPRNDMIDIIVTIAIWVSLWQLAKLLTQDLSRGQKIFVYLTVTIIGVLILYRVFQDNEKLDALDVRV